MVEVQIHGNLFEDTLIKNITGYSKKEYEKYIKNGYSSSLDLHKGIFSNFNASIKTTGGSVIGCGDIVRFMNHCKQDSFKLVIAKWEQINSNQKEYNKIYEFNFHPKFYSTIFGNLDEETIRPFVDYVKSIPEGKKFQTINQPIWKRKRDEIIKKTNTGLIRIDAKIDSKRQRRVQCSLNLIDLLNTEIECSINNKDYQGIILPYVVCSKKRKIKDT